MNTMESGHGGNIFVLPKDRREQFLDFSANINPLGLSPRGKEALCAHWERECLRYPDARCRDLKAALARHYGMPEGSITCGNGATELMYDFVRTMKPSAVYVPAPSFSEYRLAAEAEGIPVHSFLLDPDRHFAVKDERFLQELPKGALVFLGHPNNPDGQLLPVGSFYRFTRAVENAEGWLMIDESFIDFLDGQVSFREEVLRHPRVVIVMSLTKFYAVPGLRIGITFSSKTVAARLEGALCPWHVNGPVQLYLSEAVQDEEYIEASRDFTEGERRRMHLLLSGLSGVQVYDGTVNFLLLRLTDSRWTGTGIAEAMAARKILIRQCANYEGLDDSFVRIAVRTEAENDQFLQALREVLQQ